MGITIIRNQVVEFNKVDLSCICWERPFCQLVNKNDETQFEIKSDQLNPSLSTLSDWDIIDGIELFSYPVNTESDECTGEIEVEVTGGNGGPYTYSIDGIYFQDSNLFTGLCEGVYVITAKDSDGIEGSKEFEIFVNVNCSDFECTTLEELIDSGVTLGQVLNCRLGDFACHLNGAGYDPNYIFFPCSSIGLFSIGQHIGVEIDGEIFDTTIVDITNGVLPGVGSGCYLTLEDNLITVPIAVKIIY